MFLCPDYLSKCIAYILPKILGFADLVFLISIPIQKGLRFRYVAGDSSVVFSCRSRPRRVNTISCNRAIFLPDDL